ncbi:tyrosine-type recombinase/integrase [Nonomuraea sp. M3C6]|uniref:Tyrosine-type recombinase/integrase n=1 Tax=Nonomuraea marmarensis TaxID=3351344 RepID=A0ABW7AV71_9ACTN
MTSPAPAAGLRALAEDYLALRRRLGFELDKPAFLIRRFAEYCDDAGIDLVTTQAVLDWVLLAQPVAPTYRWLRLNAARGFAGYLHVLDPSHQVPPSDLVPYRHDRPTPCIMTGEQLEILMDAAGRLRPALHAATFQTLIGLVAATGMRTCEAVRADDDDIDPAEGAMTLHGKNHKDRRIPLHPTTLEALAGYQRLRDQLVPHRAGQSLLINTRGRRLNADLTRTHFAHLVNTAGLGTLTPRPTLRALRHTFAVTTLIGWLNDDADTQASLPLLSAQLGHTKPRHTFWYLQAVPELLQAASDHLLRATARSVDGEGASGQTQEEP